MKFMKKNYIIGIAITLAVLMCMPVLTINAIDSMSGGKCENGAINYSMTTAETTVACWGSLDEALGYYLGNGTYDDPVPDRGMFRYTKTKTPSIYVRYDPLSKTGWYYISGRSTEFTVA